MLRVWVAPDGNNTTIIKEQKLAAVEWGAKVRAGSFSRQEACQALYFNIFSKLKYPLPVCTLIESERVRASRYSTSDSLFHWF